MALTVSQLAMGKSSLAWVHINARGYSGQQGEKPFLRIVHPAHLRTSQDELLPLNTPVIDSDQIPEGDGWPICAKGGGYVGQQARVTEMQNRKETKLTDYFSKVAHKILDDEN
ncbi:hypothetical protein APHAL10511_006824 [Amanita phalloides]|nr:hypothetical protein APHAL10511_006824 [Amanita phalloides]